MSSTVISERKQMEKNDIQTKIAEEEDYIHCLKYNHSLAKLLNKNPDGVSKDLIAKYLLISEKQVDKIYNQAVKILRKKMLGE